MKKLLLSWILTKTQLEIIRGCLENEEDCNTRQTRDAAINGTAEDVERGESYANRLEELLRLF